jgi:hypothetical protein
MGQDSSQQCRKGQFFTRDCYQPNCFSASTSVVYYQGTKAVGNENGFCQSCRYCTSDVLCDTECDVVVDPPHDLESIEMLLGVQIQSKYNPAATNTTSADAWESSKVPTSSDVAYFPSTQGWHLALHCGVVAKQQIDNNTHQLKLMGCNL